MQLRSRLYYSVPIRQHETELVLAHLECVKIGCSNVNINNCNSSMQHRNIKVDMQCLIALIA